MKRNYIIALITILTLTISSCGKSEKEIKIEKENLEVHKQKVSVGKRKKITELTIQLQKFPEALKKAEKNIQDIGMFKIGRIKSTKERQLRKAYLQLNELREYEKKLKNEIAQSEYLKTFEFQKNPKDIMNYIFESAKKGDFSNFRYLCDPYGENDRDVNQICMAEMLTKKQKAEFQNMFKNGRIIGDPFFIGDNVQIEFAFGPSSNKLEKMGMIRRNELWYLSGY
jgi:hypothetical protein